MVARTVRGATSADVVDERSRRDSSARRLVVRQLANYLTSADLGSAAEMAALRKVDEYFALQRNPMRSRCKKLTV